MLQKILKSLTQKGQGVVEYALILGFVAIIAVYLISGSGLTGELKNNVDNAKEVVSKSRL